MAFRNLREKYGNKKARQVVNAAIRAELPGGTEAIEALSRLQSRHAAARGNGDPAAGELKLALELVQHVTDRMAAEIGRRYRLGGSNPGKLFRNEA